MSSQVDVINRALSKLGAARILSLADNVKGAREASAAWDSVVDAELRANNWNFAIKRASLPALVSTPVFGFGYSYQLPSNWLRSIQVGDFYPGPSMADYRNGQTAPYQVEGRTIVTDMVAPLHLRYVSRVTDTGQWDALFAEAVSSKLAYEMCEAITGSSEKRQAAMADYMLAIGTAKQTDAIENPPEELPDSSWLIARL